MQKEKKNIPFFEKSALISNVMFHNKYGNTSLEINSNHSPKYWTQEIDKTLEVG
jgi:hypothetical protein